MKFETLKLLRHSWRLIAPYWKSEEKYKAFGLLAAILVLTLANIGLTVRLTYWSQAFYNALEVKNYQQFLNQIKVFFIIIVIFVPVVIANSALTSWLQFRWRQWMTDHFMNEWVKKNTYYHVMVQKDHPDNPDQRISQDLDLFPSLSLGLFLSFFEQIVTLFSFAIILWTISTGIPLKIGAHTFHIQGYLLWAAFLYAFVGTLIVVRVGQPLIKLNFMQQHYEANFRYGLIRVQDKREEIAMFGGIKPEMRNLKDAFANITNNYYAIIWRSVYINFCYVSFVNISQIIPILAVAPMYFGGVIMLGVVIQVLRSFEQVRTAFSVIASNFSTIASWRASANRLLELDGAMSRAKANIIHNKISIQASKNAIKVRELDLYKPNNEELLENINFEIKSGEKIWLRGGSGIGKSTIIRAIRGLWVYGNGKINLPEHVFYIPQRPYMPLGTLREAMLYPLDVFDIKVKDEELVDILKLFKLDDLTNSLDEKRDWSTTLSLGEQQRVSFIRILINKPKYIIMDEPTSSLNIELEKIAFETLLNRLKDSTVVTIGHSETLKKFHERVINVEQWITKSNAEHLALS
jgi:vitamin B12/bleomycin/antimicrobial peptide transport system ATP-binding/permease protein